MSRPHGPLLDALRSLGATIEVGGDGFVVDGVAMPDSVELDVRADRSSQYASALAMLAATGHPVTLHLVDAEGVALSRPASAPYLRITLSMLAAAGVDSDWDESAGVLTLSPTSALFERRVLEAHGDESSAAIWRAARALGFVVQLDGMAAADTCRQPDRVMGELAARIVLAEADEVVTCSLADCPDLAPVLSALAVLSEPAVEIVDAEHLRIKESNRIDDLVACYAGVGVDVEAREDGMFIPAGIQAPEPGAFWPTHHDHRLAMAGLLLTWGGAELVVEAQGVVAKSYPELWQHARAAGWRVERA